MKLTVRQIERLVKQGEVVHTECKDASDYHGRQGIVVEKMYNEIKVSNPGTMRISKEIAIEGGRSDPRNAQVFNIFSLIGIGERSGTGLSNLYALWDQHGFATPVIREEFDPEKTIVNIATESNQPDSDTTRTEPVQGVPQGAPRIDNKLDNKLDNKSDLMSSLDNNSQSSQGGPRPDQDPTKIRPIAWSDLPSSCRQVYEALKQDAFITYRGMVSKLGLNKDTINTAIGTLVQKGFIRREGNKQTGHWEIVK